MLIETQKTTAKIFLKTIGEENNENGK